MPKLKKLSTTAGKPRAQIAAESLVRRNKILAYLDHSGEQDTNAIAKAIGLHRTIVYHCLHHMQKTGHVTVISTGDGNSSNVWLRGSNKEPMFAMESGRAYQVVESFGITRKFSKARQVGMVRDPMVAAFFGQAAT